MVFVCGVPNCNSKGQTSRAFPIMYEEIYNIWIERIGNPKLKNMDPEVVFKRYRLCDKHFSDFCRIPGERRLKFGSLPTLFLPGYQELPTEENSQYKYGSLSSTSIIGESSQLDEVNIPEQAHTNRTESEVSAHADPTSMQYISKPSSPIAGTSRDCTTPPQQMLTSSTVFKTPISMRSGKRRTLLETVNVSRVAQLTPKAKKFYKVIKNLQKVKRRLELRSATTKTRLQAAHRYSRSLEFSSVVNNTTYNFLVSQIEQQRKEPKGRRYTSDDKILALSLLKHGYKGYRLLRSIFALPSRKTLMKLLNKIKFDCGINHQILNNLREVVAKMPEKNKFCSLVFDEMSLSVGLEYDIVKDTIIGFEDYGPESKTTNFADHVLVFMLRGLHKKWKQPIAFTFTEHCTPTVKLGVLIKNIIQEVNGIGLHIIAIVCDQGSNNRAAIKRLKEETHQLYQRKNEENRNFGFEIAGQEVIPVFDPPHLIKGMRNTLLSKDVRFTINGENKEGSWDDIIKLYHLDSRYEEKKLCLKLTDQHVIPEKISKMKVRMATQVFSQRVSSILNFAAETGILPNSAYGTSDFILFMDKLFDSVNGSSVYAEHGKALRTAITANSPHLEFWNEAIVVLRSIKFINKNNRHQTSVPPSTVNWIHTLQALKCIWRKLEQHGFKFLSLRNLNQDPIENFFGCIRSQGFRNVNPTCRSFINSFKTLLINNFFSPHSAGFNCEEDSSDGALDNLKNLIDSEVSDDEVGVEEIFVLPTNVPLYVESDDIIGNNINNYIAGFVAKKIIEYTKNCNMCKSYLLGTDNDGTDNNYLLIQKRSYGPSSLKVPSTSFSKIFSQCLHYLKWLLPKVCNENHLKKKLITFLKSHVYMPANICHDHDVFIKILEFCSVFYIISWTKSVNKLLKGHNYNNACNIVFSDFIKKAALEKYKKSFKFKK